MSPYRPVTSDYQVNAPAASPITRSGSLSAAPCPAAPTIVQSAPWPHRRRLGLTRPPLTTS